MSHRRRGVSLVWLLVVLLVCGAGCSDHEKKPRSTGGDDAGTGLTDMEADRVLHRLVALGNAPYVAVSVGDLDGDGRADLVFRGSPTTDVGSAQSTLKSRPQSSLGGVPTAQTMQALEEDTNDVALISNGTDELGYRVADDRFDYAGLKLGGLLTGSDFAQAFETAATTVSRSIVGTLVKRCVVVGAVLRAGWIVARDTPRLVNVLFGALGVEPPSDLTSYETCLTSGQTEAGCLGVLVLDFFGRTFPKSLPFLAPGQHCYQVPGPACDDDSKYELCNKANDATHCCNADFIYGSVFRADIRNQAPFPIKPSSGPIPDGATDVMLDGSGIFVSGVSIQLPDSGSELWMAPLKCLMNDLNLFESRLTKNPIRLTVDPAARCARNTALPGHFLAGWVDQCISDDTSATYTRIKGQSDPDARFKSLNENQGAQIFQHVADDFHGRVQKALSAIADAHLCCKRGALQGGTLTVAGDSITAVATSGAPTCSDDADGGVDGGGVGPQPGADGGHSGADGGTQPPLGAADGCGVVRDCADPTWPAPLGAQGAAAGDPHLRTFDGLAYDFQAVGEFTLVQDSPDLEIQIRTKPWGTRTDVALNTAVAAKIATNVVVFHASGSVLLDGTARTFADGKTSLSGGGSVRRFGDSYTVVWPNQSQLRLHPRGDFMEVEVFLPETRQTHPLGLLGKYMGKSEQTIVTRSGQTIDTKPPFETFYGVYAESWRIKQQDSLFDYGTNETTETYTDRSFPHRLAQTSALESSVFKSAEDTCRAAGVTDPQWLDACILDVGITGDPRFAEEYARLSAPTGVFEIQPPPPDQDDDGTPDKTDNCPSVSNRDQSDVDHDGQGDACDGDIDGDARDNAVDNCPKQTNADQKDTDADKVGDACDDCPAKADADQKDGDADGVGDVCDNCSSTPNRNQANADADAQGDACDTDSDNDGVPNATDNCAQTSNANQADADKDGIGDACDGLQQSRVDVIHGGGLAFAGVGLAGRGATALTKATLTVQGIPTGSKVRSALLYYDTIGGADATISLDGTALTTTLIGTAADTCWSKTAGNFAYRADVTSLVTGNGAHVLTDFPSSTSAAIDGQGASVLVVYEDPANTKDTLIAVGENIVATTTSGQSMTSTLKGFTVPKTYDAIWSLNVVGDGQTFADRLAFNSIDTGVASVFVGANGFYWDTLKTDVGRYVNPGDTSFATRVDATEDCLVWIVNALVIEGYVAP